MPITYLSDWLVTHSRTDCVWYMKRLAANDTHATGSHQVGMYIEKKFIFKILPVLNDPNKLNPDIYVDAHIDSHADYRKVRITWYNNKTRDETRITRWGGVASALLDPDSTGALAIFVFYPATTDGVKLHIWVCDNAIEEDLAEENVGPVEPGQSRVWTPGDTGLSQLLTSPSDCDLALDEFPEAWLEKFPTGYEIVEKTLELQPLKNKSCDERLIYRRECEYQLFLSLEKAYELPRITAGFGTIDEFVSHAQTILQRRKSRSGRSLELQTKAILVEEGLIEGQSFEYGVQSEPKKRPDFIFPSQALYHDPSFPETNLRMLAVKTTCKDRWRQVLQEAAKVPVKHLLTLQEGVSEAQFDEMEQSGIKLVVPVPRLKAYPTSIRPKLMTLEDFISEVRHLGILS